MTAERTEHAPCSWLDRRRIACRPDVDKRRIVRRLLQERDIHSHRLPALRHPQASAVDHSHDFEPLASTEVERLADGIFRWKETARQALTNDGYRLRGLAIVPIELAAGQQMHSGPMKEPRADHFDDSLHRCRSRSMKRSRLP